jgi:hypothetical protein
MSELPSVACVMLCSPDPARQKFRERAIECFLRVRSLYRRAETQYWKALDLRQFSTQYPTIGEMRNAANEHVRADIIIHWDDDDWSCPTRVAEQVRMLQATGAEIVGYNEMFFARTSPGSDAVEAWLYSQRNRRYALGTSLCYWRHVWQRRHFEHTSSGEDQRFISGLNIIGVSALRWGYDRMVARIHGGNTCSKIEPGCSEWTRAPQYDQKLKDLLK